MSAGHATAGAALTSPRPQLKDWGRRALDIVLAAIAIAVLAPLLVLLWASVRLDSPGPVVFRQQRLGRNARPFTIFKFRTMRVDTDDAIHRAYVTQLLTQENPEAGGSAGLFKLENDPRITRIGALLRRTSLDELPQLFNILRGEMSLVGPRPALAWEAELYDDRHWARFEVPPGLTGLWQVNGRSELTMRQALDLDLDYVQRRSVPLDLLIILKTIPALLRSQAT
jgi:lipopolysaccharide/colanic/teichoic acid biosynthesis glycosyltransferase